MEINDDAFEMDKAALMHYKENLIFILKKNTTMHEKLSYLQSFEDLGVMKLGCIDSNDHNYRRFIDRLEECGIRFAPLPLLCSLERQRGSYRYCALDY